jgi:hypothetical protein
MATIKANGGAASVWERSGHHSDGTPYTLRVVLCRNGKVLTGIGTGTYHHAQAPKLGHWRASPSTPRKWPCAISALSARRVTPASEPQPPSRPIGTGTRSTLARSVALPASVEGSWRWHGSPAA